jgi:phytoene dehydrogenase-like protein
VIDHEVFGDVILPDGRRLVQYADMDRLVAELKSVSLSAAGSALDSHDIAALDRLAKDVKLWGSLKMPMGKMSARHTGLLTTLRGLWKIRRYLPVIRRFGGTVEHFAARFHSPDLQCFFRSAVPIPGMPAMTLLMMLTVVHKKEAGWPEGGSLELSRSIARRYDELGGVIRYGAKVQEIIVRDGKAMGVRLTDGSEHLADEVVSAADGRATLFDMLKGHYMSGELRALYEKLPLYTPVTQVSFGVNRDLAGSSLPRLSTFNFHTPLRIGQTEVPWLMLNSYSFDPSLSPRGKSVLTLISMSPWKLWEGLSGDREAYRAEKTRVLEDATAWMESQLPGISKDIEVTDVATPLTTVRYTGNYHSSYEGWRPTPKTLRQKIDKRLPGLSHFSMVGQWTSPAAGLPTVASDGRIVIQELCEQDGREFTTSVPTCGKQVAAVAAAR